MRPGSEPEGSGGTLHGMDRSKENARRGGGLAFEGFSSRKSAKQVTTEGSRTIAGPYVNPRVIQKKLSSLSFAC